MNEENITESRNKEEEKEYHLLVTRANSHRKLSDIETTLTSKSKRKTNYLSRFLSCVEHKTVDRKCPNCLVFPVQGALPNGKLPSGKQVLGYLFYTNSQETGQRQNNIHNVAADVMNHWIACNVYTVTYINVKSKLEKIMDTYTNKLKKTSCQEER